MKIEIQNEGSLVSGRKVLWQYFQLLPWFLSVLHIKELLSIPLI